MSSVQSSVTVFNPVYTLPSENPIEKTLEIGIAVKDLQENQTQMKKDYLQEVQKVSAAHEIAMTQFQKDKAAATEQAYEKVRPIREQLAKISGKLRAMEKDLVALMVLTGGIIAIAIIALPPLLFAAIPIGIGMAGLTYSMVTKTIKQEELQKKMSLELQEALNISEPQLKLPSYDAAQNLDAKKNRDNALQRLVGVRLQDLANSPWSNNQIVQYALLDRVATLDERTRPLFYAKVIQLIDAYRTIKQQNADYVKKAKIEHWAREAEIEDNEGRWAYILRHRKYNTLTVLQNGSPAAATEKYHLATEENDEQLQTNLRNIHNQFDLAIQELEKQFAEARDNRQLAVQ